MTERSPDARGAEATSVPAVEIAPNALLESPVGWLVVVSVGQTMHSAGYGPVDFTAFRLSGMLDVGGILVTPWGAVEIVKEPAVCRVAYKRWDGRLSYGTQGTPAAVGRALAAAKALGHTDLGKMHVEFEPQDKGMPDEHG